ncbi:MAG: hypothetical protein ACRBC3_23030 [Burkholderiaceae bacterium]
MADADPVIHHSPLCQTAVLDGVTLDLQIYKTDDSRWLLEVVNETGTSIVWDDQFDTDRAAFDEFTRTLETEGLAAFEDE